MYRPLNCKELLSIVNDLESIVIENKVNLVKSMLYLEYISECMSVSVSNCTYFQHILFWEQALILMVGGNIRS